ncbi:MAG: hypothetical protein LBB21_05425 [Holosporaceae bacterium]|jgi:hypothetical protein|nr:hypothetical protein [Holosporaceae bacterium]
MNKVGISKEMMERIESLHIMDKNELFETYGEMIPDLASEDINEVKLELAYLIYAILYCKEPSEMKRDQIYRYFKYLEMQDELRAYSCSKSTQRIVRKIYMANYDVV